MHKHYNPISSIYKIVNIMTNINFISFQLILFGKSLTFGWGKIQVSDGCSILYGKVVLDGQEDCSHSPSRLPVLRMKAGHGETNLFVHLKPTTRLKTCYYAKIIIGGDMW